MRELLDVDGGNIDRQIDEEGLAGTGSEKRRQQRFVVLLRHGNLDEGNAFLVRQMLVVIIWIDDREPVPVTGDMAQDEGEGAPPDRA